MQSLRIALGLLSLVVALFLMLPAEPTLFAGRTSIEAPAAAEARGDTAQPPATARPEPLPAAPIRTVGPVPAETAALRRLPPVSSGAATPVRASEPEAPATVETAQTEEAETTAPAEEPAVAAAPEPDGPAYRLFARPIAVDAGTLKAGEFTLVVAGVEPVPSDVRCADGAQAWPCAVRARTALRGWIRGRSVLCAVPPESADARDITAPCLLGEEDVGEWVIRNGWAHAAPGSRYEAAEEDAREARRGIWAYALSDEASVRSEP